MRDRNWSLKRDVEVRRAFFAKVVICFSCLNGVNRVDTQARKEVINEFKSNQKSRE